MTKNQPIRWIVKAKVFHAILPGCEGASSVQFAYEKDGEPTFACIETVSPDGTAMTEEFTNTIKTQPVSGKAKFTRVSQSPSGGRTHFQDRGPYKP
ncbi:MAG: hypothetical protein WB762_12305 [Candidatus Sulfotelmatobacter sp.]